MTTLDTTTNNRFEWGVIFIGAAIACGISIVMMQFGSVIGLSADGAYAGLEDMAMWGVVATGIWILWVQLLASLAGGYTAGYLRRPTPTFKAHENELHDGFYGFGVWAVSTIAVFIAISIAAMAATYVEIQTDAFDVNETMSDSDKNTAIIFAFVTGATSLLSAVAAWWAATMGGDHRAQGVDFSAHLTFKKK